MITTSTPSQGGPIESPRKGLRATATGLAAVTLICQLLGLAASILLTSVLGASRDTDAFMLALLVPSLATGLLITALRSGAIPELTKVDREGDRARFSRDVSSLVTSATLIAAGSGLVVCLVLIAVIPILLPGWSNYELHRFSIFSLILVPYTALAGSLGAMSAALAVRNSFRPAVAAWGFESVGRMGFLLATPSLGAMNLALGTLIGQLAAAAFLVFVMARVGIRLRPTRSILPPVVKKSFALAAPLMIAAFALQFNPVLDRVIAGSLSGGAITQLEIASRLSAAPQTILGSVMIAPLVANWSTMVLDSRMSDLTESLHRVIGAATFASFFIIATLLPLRTSVVSLMFGRGRFTPEDVQITAGVFALLLLGMAPALMKIGCAAFFVARKDTRFNMKVAFVSLSLNAALSVSLAQVLGLYGVVLGTTLTSAVGLTLYLRGVRRRDATFSIMRLAKQISLAACCLLMGGMTGAALTAMCDPGSNLPTIVLIGVASALTFMVPIAAVARKPRAALEMVSGRDLKTSRGT